MIAINEGKQGRLVVSVCRGSAVRFSDGSTAMTIPQRSIQLPSCTQTLSQSPSLSLPPMPCPALPPPPLCVTPPWQVERRLSSFGPQDGQGVRRLLRDCLLLRNEMSAMTIAVQYYLTFEVIEGECAEYSHATDADNGD